MPRILICRTHKTVDVLPDYDTASDMEGLYDYHLQDAIKDHFSKYGDDPRRHASQMLRIDEDEWDLIDPTKLKDAIMNDSLEEYLKGEREQYKEDAVNCYLLHNKPVVGFPGCADYRDSSRAIGRTKGIPDAEKVYLCDFCLPGDTMVPTRTGARPIRDLVGTASLLVAPTHGTWGSWRDVDVRYLGQQELWEVEMQKGANSRKVVRCTAEHRWDVADGGVVATQSLVPGDRLRSLYSTPISLTGEHVSVIGAMQGFVFGDGTLGTGNRPASVTVYDSAPKDIAVVPLFAGLRNKEFHSEKQNGITYCDLPRSWKRVPDLEESRSFLLGWAAGYFAADGTVSDRGQATLFSSIHAHLQAFKDVATLLGLSTSPIRTKQRTGFGKVSSLHSITLSRYGVPDEFWLLDEHRQRALAAGQPSQRDWVVTRVTRTGVVEDVFCPVVPSTERFALEDGLMTMNCPYQSYVDHAKRKAYGI